MITIKTRSVGAFRAVDEDEERVNLEFNQRAVKKTEYIKVCQMKDDFMIDAPTTQYFGKKGDYLAMDNAGGIYKISVSDYERFYETVKEK